MRRIMIAVATAVLVISAGVGSAEAFEPPADPAGKFSCDPTAIGGHPGAGLGNAMARSGNVAAWNAVNNADPIAIC